MPNAALLPFVAAFGGIWFYTYDGRPKCDDASVVATVKSLASDRLQSSPRSLLDTGSSKDFRSRQGMLKELSNPDYRKPPKPEYTLSAVRDRGAFGKYGTSCAAVVQILLGGNVTDFSTTYDVEPASDGKTMITARFQPTG